MTTREEWAGQTGKTWSAQRDAQDLMLAPAGKAGLTVLGARPGERILDLGCGAGASTEALAAAVAPGGGVVGVDVSPDLVAIARQRIGSEDGVEVIEADAESHAFTAHSFDALFSRFGAMFFDNPPRAFANLHGALKPGARAVFLAWQDPSRNQWASVPMTFAAEGLSPARPSGGPGPFAWAEPEVFRSVLAAGGFSGVRQTTFDYMAEISDGNDEDPVNRAISAMVKIGPLASRLRDASDTAKHEAQAFLRRRLARHVRDGAVRLMASVWIIEAWA